MIMVGFLTLFIMWAIAMYGIFSCNHKSINILSCFIVFQNFVLVLISGMIDESVYFLIVLTKEIYVVLLILFAMLKKKRTARLDFGCCLCIFVLLVMSVSQLGGNRMSVLSSFRQLYLPFMFFLMGRSLNLSYKEVKKSEIFFVRLSVIVVIFGIFEWATGDWFWSHTSIGNYYEYKGFTQYVYGGRTLHGGVYSFDFYPLFVFRRMISFMVDPVILGQLLSVSVILAMFDRDIIPKQKTRYVYSCFLAVGLLLTFTKSGIMVSAIAFVALTNKIWRKYLFSKMAFMVALASVVLFIVFSVNNNQSTLNHINGLLDGVSVFKNNIFGIGIGRYGNLTTLYGEAVVEGSGESFIGSMVAQSGIIGIFLYGYFYYNIFRKLRRKDDNLSTAVLWLNVALFATEFFNNTSISFTNCYIFFMLAGCCTSPSYSKEEIGNIRKGTLCWSRKAVQY